MPQRNNNQNNLPLMIGLGSLAIAAIAGLSYMSSHLNNKSNNTKESLQENIAEAPQSSNNDLPEIIPGNPVVATIGDVQIKRAEVASYVRTLPPHLQQMPIDQIFPIAVDQLINEKLVRIRAAKADMDNHKVVKERLAKAKKEIIATIYLQESIAKIITDEKLKAAHEAYVSTFETVDEARASHILVDEKDLAVQIIQELEAGAVFAELAKKYSKDPISASKGGDLGFFGKADVVPEFSEAAFGLEVGGHTYQPVKSKFGYHVILLAELRQRPIPTLEDVKPTLEGQLRQQAMQDLFMRWRSEQKVEAFDINGKPYPEVKPLNSNVE